MTTARAKALAPAPRLRIENLPSEALGAHSRASLGEYFFEAAATETHRSESRCECCSLAYLFLDSDRLYGSTKKVQTMQ